MIYKNDDEIKLFGELFINNNKNNCFLLINNKMVDLCGEYIFNKKEKNIKIKLIEEFDLEDMSYMFYDCISLLSVDMSKYNINNAKNLNYMFLGCLSLNNIWDIYKWVISNINSMNSVFYDCQNLKLLPCITNSNTKNLPKKNELLIIYDNLYGKNSIRIFGKIFVDNNKNNCILIIDDKLYELTEFYENHNYKQKIKIILIETKIIVNMSYMFYNCESLSSLPDISIGILNMLLI